MGKVEKGKGVKGKEEGRERMRRAKGREGDRWERWKREGNGQGKDVESERKGGRQMGMVGKGGKGKEEGSEGMWRAKGKEGRQMGKG